MAQYLLIMQQRQRWEGCSQFGDYILTRRPDPILNLLCKPNVVPPISLVDEESFCHRAVSFVIKSGTKWINLDLCCNGQLMRQFISGHLQMETLPFFRILCIACWVFFPSFWAREHVVEEIHTGSALLFSQQWMHLHKHPDEAPAATFLPFFSLL